MPAPPFFNPNETACCSVHPANEAIETTLYGHSQLEALFQQLATHQGLFSRSTFQTLYSTLVRMVRDQASEGCVLTLSRDAHSLNALSLPLETCPQITLINLETYPVFQSPQQVNPNFGCAVFLTQQLSVALYWNSETNATYQLDQGGWSFRATDVRLIAERLAKLSEDESVQEYVLMAPCDRRYDDKLPKLVFSMVSNLEGRNRDLALALRREQLLNTQMAEQERLATIGQMSSVLAHEIRNPLGVIDVYACLVEGQLAGLEEGVLDPLVLSNLAQIRGAVQHLESVLTELTQYSRPLALEAFPVDIEALLQELHTFYLPQFEQKGVALQLETTLNLDGSTPRPLTLQADATKLRQALMNLLKNALEATPAGKQVTLALSARKGDQRVYIKVRDEGKGVSPQHQSKLFTPFFSTKGANGTGLGLAHVRKIMQAHGGSVELLHNKVGEGACFALLLPI